MFLTKTVLERMSDLVRADKEHDDDDDDEIRECFMGLCV